MSQNLSVDQSNWSDTNPDVRFTTLGMVVLDEIYFVTQDPLMDIIGGSGAYIRAKVEAWRTNLLVLEDYKTLSTRGCLKYEDAFGDKKTCRYLTPVLSILPSSLKNSAMLGSESFHFLADPNEFKEQVKELLALRRETGINVRPFILWESRPSSCTPSNLNAMFEAVREVDVFSPNNVELFASFGRPVQEPFDPKSIEQLALPFKTSGIGPTGQGSVVIRAGENGCFIASRKQDPTWLPSFYESFKDMDPAAIITLSKKVTDPTGAGSVFLGAFAIGFLDTDSFYDAACYGTVGSSFAVEHIGLPDLDTFEEEELWNKENAFVGLREYRARLNR